MKKDKSFSRIFSYKEQTSRSLSWGHHFLFLNILLTCFIGLTYIYAAPETESFIAFVYLILSWLGHMSFLAFIVYVILLFPLSFIGHFHLYRALSVAIAILFDAILLFDVKLFLAVKVHISSNVINIILGDLDFNTGLNYNFMFIAVPIVISLQIMFAKIATRGLYTRGHNFLYKGIIALVVVAFISSHSMHIAADAYRYDKINVLNSVLPAHYPMTARSFLENHGWLNNKSLPSINDSSIEYPIGKIVDVQPLPNPSNVILIFINGLSYTDINEADTPNLVKIKQKYHSFENFYLPEDNIRDNLFAAGYGISSTYRNAFEHSSVYPVTVEEMHRQEYVVRVMTDELSNISDRDIYSITGVRQAKIEKDSNPASIFQRALENIRNYTENSTRYAMCININELSDSKLSKRQSLNSLNRLDKIVAEFLEQFESIESFDNSLIFISSCQGNPNLNKEITYDRVMQHVPMIAVWPNKAMRGASSSFIASSYDFSATVARECLGITSDTRNFSMGRSLLDGRDRDFVVTTSDKNLILISNLSTTVYSRDGRSFIETADGSVPVKPNLENLIRAMRELNRFR